MQKEKISKIAWISIFICFAILIVVGQLKIKEQNEVSTKIETRKEIQKNEEEQVVISDEYKISGTVSGIIENGISVLDSEGNSHTINMLEFKNYRTRDKMNLSEIVVRRLL